MSESIVTALAVLGGTLIGGLITFITSYYLKKQEWNQEQLTREITKREQLYSDFLVESGRLLMLSLYQQTGDTRQFDLLYAQLGRIKMFSSESVIHAAQGLVSTVLKSHRLTASETADNNAEADEYTDSFSIACRKELDELKKTT